jgi:hypothetical protein
MRNFMFCLVFALSTAAVFGQDVLVLAPLQNDGQIEEGQIRTLTRLLENALQRTRKFDIIDRGAVEDILREHGFQLSDLADSQKTVELGDILGANFLVRPSVMPLAGDLFLESRIVDVKTARMVNSAEVRIRADLSGAYEKLGEFAADLTGTVGASGAAVPAIALEVTTKAAGTLYFQNRETARLWGNDTHTIPIEGPGTYTVKMVFTAGGEKSQTVIISARGITRVTFDDRYAIGERGPAGGIVFYDKGSYSNGWRYLEAAPVETEFSAQWGAYEKNVGGPVAVAGAGKRNTELIAAFLRNNRESGRAAQFCDSLVFDGYDDWFLPSKDELSLMYANLKARGLGEFSGGWYWSSSESNNNTAWDQRFSDGGQYSNHVKDNTHSVRAVRAF